MKRKGFTLVELLVVIGIIAVLISILLPTLARARESANRVKCASNLRQIAMASIAYANENKGSLPPTRFDNGPVQSPGYDYLFTYSYTNTWPVGANDIGSNIGRLLERKYLTNWSIIECPSSGRAQDDQWRQYQYNIHIKQKGTVGKKVWWNKINNFGKVPKGPVPAYALSSGTVGTFEFPSSVQRALACDFINDLEFAFHATRGGRAWNLAYIDGHVSTVTADRRLSRQGGNWARFTDMLTALEYIDSGLGWDVNNPPWNKYNYIPYEP